MSCSLWSCFRNFQRSRSVSGASSPGASHSRRLCCTQIPSGPTCTQGSSPSSWTCPVLIARRLRESRSQPSRSCPLQPIILREGRHRERLYRNFRNFTTGRAHRFDTWGFRWSRLGQRPDALWTKGALLMIVTLKLTRRPRVPLPAIVRFVV